MLAALSILPVFVSVYKTVRSMLCAGPDEFSLLSALWPLQHSAAEPAGSTTTAEPAGSTTAASAGSGHPKPENPLQRLKVHGSFFVCAAMMGYGL